MARKLAPKLIPKLIYSALVILLTFTVRFIGNPESFDWWANSSPSKPPHTSPWQLEGSVEKVSDKPLDLENYRGGMERKGILPFALAIKGTLRPLEIAPNLGIHSASKSSPLQLGTLAIVPSDGGLLQAVDVASGRIVWEVRTLASERGFHSTPVASSEYVYVGDYSGTLYAIHALTGRIVWLLSLANAIGGTPALYGDFLYVVAETGSNSFAVKVNRHSGQIVWQSEWLGEQSHSSPAVDLKTSTLVFGDNRGNVNAVELETGFFKWRFRTAGPVKGAPALDGRGSVVVGSWDGSIYRLDVGTGRQIWRSNNGELNQSSAAVRADRDWVFVNSEQGLCRIQYSEGRTRKCTGVATERRSALGSPVVTQWTGHPQDELVWVGCASQALCVYRARDLKLLNKWQLGAALSGEPRFSAGRAVLTTDRLPYVLQLSHF